MPVSRQVALSIVLVLVVAAGWLGYQRGWFGSQNQATLLRNTCDRVQSYAGEILIQSALTSDPVRVPLMMPNPSVAVPIISPFGASKHNEVTHGSLRPLPGFHRRVFPSP